MTNATTASARSTLRRIKKQILGAVGAHYLPKFLSRRIVAAGIRPDELEGVLRQSKNFDNLSHLFAAVQEARESKGRYWYELGLKPKSKDYLLNSAIWGFYASVLSTDDPDFQRNTYNNCAKSYALAAPHFKYPAQQIDIPCTTNTLKGYIRLPVADSKAAKLEILQRQYPCVILINGFNSSKEELFFVENSFLNQKIATLSFDHAGIGESVQTSRESLDLSALGNALRICIQSMPQIDPHRVAVYGASLGGAVALNLAAEFPDHYKAVASLSAPYDLASRLDVLLLSSWRQVNYLMSNDEQVIHELARKLSLKNSLGNVKSSTLIISGGKDRLAGKIDGQQIYDQVSAQDKKLLICPRARHGCYEMMPSLRYEIAQWIKQRI
jgi:pimeloyl-ACP methyl ester carboxylesterase